VDNASADGAADMVEEEFPEVLLIRNKENAGFARANNQAARRARGRYVFFLNNDTVVPPETLRTLVDHMEAYPQVGMIGPRLRGVDGEIQISCRPRPTVATFLHHTFLFRWLGLGRRAYHAYRRQDFDSDATRNVDVLMGAAVMLERERLLAWGGWEEDFTFGGEDLELSYRVNQYARVVYCPQAEIIHYGRVSTRIHASYSAPNIAVGFLKYLRKTGAGRVRLFLYKLATTLDAPVQCITKTLQSVVRYLCGRQKGAAQSALAARAHWHFLRRALIRFWRA
jgi:N-acetylglucosaminyl-diphospho-decaprenol L-rhamnosyltransferase